MIDMRGEEHHAVHNGPLARLVFTPKDDGGLHRCAVGGIEAGHNVAGCSEKPAGEHERPPLDECAGASIPGSDEEEIAA
jgi:hypothetical protein